MDMHKVFTTMTLYFSSVNFVFWTLKKFTEKFLSVFYVIFETFKFIFQKVLFLRKRYCII